MSILLGEGAYNSTRARHTNSQCLPKEYIHKQKQCFVLNTMWLKIHYLHLEEPFASYISQTAHNNMDLPHLQRHSHLLAKYSPHYQLYAFILTLNLHHTKTLQSKVRETFELHQLKSAPSQLLPVSSRFDRLHTCCHWFNPANILFFSPTAG